MGGLIQKLTKPGLQDGSGNTTFFDNNAERGIAMAHQQAGAVQPSIAHLPDLLGDPMSNTPDGTPPWSALQTPGVPPPPPKPTFTDQPTAPAPKVVQGDFNKESQDQYGNEKPLSAHSGLTKLGALFSVLRAGAQGAVEGRAASERALAQSGGRTNGGFGSGFEASSYDMPMLRVAKKQREMRGEEEMQRGAIANDTAQVQNQTARANLAFLPITKTLAVQQAQANIRRSNALAGWNEWKTMNPKADAQAQLEAKLDFARKFGLDDEEQKKFVFGIAPQGPEKSEFGVWQQQNPNGTVEQYLQARSNIAHSNDRDPEDKTRPHAPTRGEFQQAEVRKNSALDKLEAQYQWKQDQNAFEDTKTGQSISKEEHDARKQRIQNNYENEVRALTGNQPNHVDIGGSAQPAKAAPASPQTKAAPAAKVDVTKASRAVRNPQTGAVAYLIGGQWYDKNGAPMQAAH